MIRTVQRGMKGAFVAVMAAAVLGMMSATSAAKAGETAHLRLGLDGADEVVRGGELRPRRNLGRFVARDVVRRVHREVIRDVILDVRRDVIRDVRTNRHRVAWVLRDDRAQVRDALRQVRQQLRELEARLEAEGWR